LQILITVKNPSPWLGLNPWTLDPTESTLTITPPRQQESLYFAPLLDEPTDVTSCEQLLV
jgi:hypothetical protein